MSNTTYNTNDNILLTDGTVAIVVGYSKGWYKVIDETGTERSVRAKQIAGLVEGTNGSKEKGQQMSETLKRYATGYTKCVSNSGKLSLNNGDEIAILLAGFEVAVVMRLAEILAEEPENSYKAKYAHLNNGQRRMVCGNRIRGMFAAGDITMDDIKKAIKQI